MTVLAWTREFIDYFEPMICLPIWQKGRMSMTLALVQAMVAIILTIVATWTGLLVSVAFLLPGNTARSERLISFEPWKCFFSGLGIAVVLAIGLVLASAGPPLIKLIGLGILMAVGAVIAIGSAGVAQTIGKRGEPDGVVPTFGMLVRGSLVYSLGLGFPLVGWFVFAPLALTMAAGAGIMAFAPGERTSYSPPGVPPSSGEYDLSSRSGVIS